MCLLVCVEGGGGHQEHVNKHTLHSNIYYLFPGNIRSVVVSISHAYSLHISCVLRLMLCPYDYYRKFHNSHCIQTVHNDIRIYIHCNVSRHTKMYIYTYKYVLFVLC